MKSVKSWIENLADLCFKKEKANSPLFTSFTTKKNLVGRLIAWKVTAVDINLICNTAISDQSPV